MCVLAVKTNESTFIVIICWSVNVSASLIGWDPRLNKSGLEKRGKHVYVEPSNGLSVIFYYKNPAYVLQI
jgi:hypothetical protein